MLDVHLIVEVFSKKQWDLMKKVVRFNIRSKKPNDVMKQKFPIQEKVPSIKEKKPNSPIKQFELPPSRKNDNYIPKKKSTIPSTKGSIPKSQRKKDPVNRKVPKRLSDLKDREHISPLRRGIAKKKVKRMINKKPPQSVQEKSPKRRIIPPSMGSKPPTIPKKTIKSKTPPKSN
ncbi:MAG: hypothetical protein ACXABG_09990, partial [Promethearchaeota archaeon]